MSDTVRVYIDGQGLDAPAGGCVLDALEARDADLARAVVDGVCVVTDSRGLPIPHDALLHGGAIFRTAPARHRARPATEIEE